jgi:hypothetical protein
MAVVPIGNGAFQIIYKTPEGTIKKRLVSSADEAGIGVPTTEQPWNAAKSSASILGARYAMDVSSDVPELCQNPIC